MQCMSRNKRRPRRICSLRISLRRNILSSLLIHPFLQVRGQELRVCIAALHRLGETERAHQLLLASYGAKIRSGARALRPGGTSYGGAYTAALAQVSV